IKEAVPEINKFLDEYGSYSFNKKKQYNSLYLYSVSALVKLGDNKAYAHLLDAMKNDNPSTRLRAIKLLKDMKDKRSIDILKYKMQYDPSVQVQKAAKEALTEMGVDVGKDDEPKKTEPTKNPAPAKGKGSSKPQDDEQQPDDQVKKRDDF
ncbi:MAG TPA: HEAT repeat domain-containing protein, partial [Spirochaetota bacterium]|nr:HEAT repeat domain-containing protein [Spirochaetota bacterium]